MIVVSAPTETGGGGVRLDTQRLTWQELDAEAVVLDLASSTYFTLNRTGTLLFTMLTEERSEEELVSRLAAQVDDSTQDVAGDVAAFLHDLRARGLIID